MTRGVGIRHVIRVARDHAPVAIGPGVVERLTRARAVVDRAAAGDTPVYGLNSALGANTGARLAKDEQGPYQVRAVRARAVGVGPPSAPTPYVPRCSHAQPAWRAAAPAFPFRCFGR